MLHCMCYVHSQEKHIVGWLLDNQSSVSFKDSVLEFRVGVIDFRVGNIEGCKMK